MKVIYKTAEEAAARLFDVMNQARELVKEEDKLYASVGFNDDGKVEMGVSTTDDKLGSFILPIVFDSFSNDDSDIEWTLDEIETEIYVMVELGEITLTE